VADHQHYSNAILKSMFYTVYYLQQRGISYNYNVFLKLFTNISDLNR